MVTSLWRWLGRNLVGRQVHAAEFRAERMDAAWQAEYLEIGGRDSLVSDRIHRLMHR